MSAPPDEAPRDRPPVPYLSFETFKNFIDSLSGGRPLPARIDRSLMQGMAGGTQTLLLSSLTSFALIGEAREVLPALLDITNRRDEERHLAYVPLVQRFYAEQLTLSREQATADQLAESFRRLSGYQGSTLRKAITFFLNMARYAEIPLSPYFRAPAQVPSGGKAVRLHRRTKAVPVGLSSSTSPPVAQEAETAPESRSVRLRSGGTITVSCSASFLSLSREDRDFVFELVDRLLEYQEADAGPSLGKGGSGGPQ